MNLVALFLIIVERKKLVMGNARAEKLQQKYRVKTYVP